MGKKGSTKRKKTFRVIYQNTPIFVPMDESPRKGICNACGRKKPVIKQTALHHWKYAYKKPTVEKDPKKALENTTEFCFSCHKLADALRVLMNRKEESIDLILNVAEQMPEDMQKKFEILCWGYIQRRDNRKDLNRTPIKDMY